MRFCRLLPLPWREPADVLRRSADLPYCVGLLSDGSSEGRWSYVASDPAAVFDSLPSLAAGLVRWQSDAASEFPPFRGGAIGLAAYEWGASLEPAAPQERSAHWPDLAGGFYDRVYAFDHARHEAWAIGRGDTADAAADRADLLSRDFAAGGAAPERALSGASFRASTSGGAYQAAVASVVESVVSGEIFQANVAREWCGALADGATPFDVLDALRRSSPAPFAGYLRLPGLALVSNSPERFMAVTAAGAVRTQPIKGTRPRGATPKQDAVNAAELLQSTKDFAENLMIVDLMRNDLARTCAPGSVSVPELCALKSFANVHHLVSTVSGRLAEGRTALDAFACAFPPGSITGAPKLQAMRVIARHEAPRGPYCGSLFYAGCDGAFDSSVLIRTLAFSKTADRRWQFHVRAGAAVTSDSTPLGEDEETLAKIGAIRAALAGP
jgi:para-aminobenzoate synthetase component 1